MPNAPTGARYPLLWLFFGLKGRISRGVYWGGYIALASLASAVVFQSMSEGKGTLYAPALIIEPVVAFVGLYANIALAWKRLHDFGKNGLFALILLVPVLIAFVILASGSLAFAPIASLINLGATIWFGIPQSDAGANRYGRITNAPAE